LTLVTLLMNNLQERLFHDIINFSSLVYYIMVYLTWLCPKRTSYHCIILCCLCLTHLRHTKFLFNSFRSMLLVLILEWIDLLYNLNVRLLSRASNVARGGAEGVAALCEILRKLKNYLNSLMKNATKVLNCILLILNCHNFFYL